MKHKIQLTILITTIMAIAGALFFAGPAGQKQPSTSEIQHAGYVVHFDPATGQWTDQATGAVSVTIDEGLRNALSSSAEGLEEVPSTVEGGGTMVDLQGRFQNAMFSAIDKNGQLQAPCMTNPPDSACGTVQGPDKGGEVR